jgi:hypothetical protein
LNRYKKIFILFIKVVIGLLSFWVIYAKLSGNVYLKGELSKWGYQSDIYLSLLVVLILMPLNWGIESYKWKLVTKQLESISYQTALKSIFSGICIGNIAPGRSMEFLARIYFFKSENKPSATILHFINGMFQMIITLSVGFIAASSKLGDVRASSYFFYIILAGAIILIACFCWIILHPTRIQKKLGFIKWFKNKEAIGLKPFSKTLLLKVLSLSIIRYMVFTLQFYLIYQVLSPQSEGVFASIAMYFMLTSIIPMISVIEPSIRAAIALFVFSGTANNEVSVILSSTVVWIINVVIPSIIGYMIILKEKIEFKSFHAH